MGIELLAIFSLSFVYGIRHAIEPDHVIAVSTIASRSKKLGLSSLAGVFWGIGHTATLFILGLITILLKVEIPEKWSMSLEFLVGIMLVYLGVSSMTSLRNIHLHEGNQEWEPHKYLHSHEQHKEVWHRHTLREVSYIRSLLIGFVHGLAGSAAMVVFTMSKVSSIGEGAVYILIFGFGTVVGMLLCTTLIGIPFVASKKRFVLNRNLTKLTGLISTVFGMYYMYNLGVSEGLFRLWLP